MTTAPAVALLAAAALACWPPPSAAVRVAARSTGRRAAPPWAAWHVAAPSGPAAGRGHASRARRRTPLRADVVRAVSAAAGRRGLLLPGAALIGALVGGPGGAVGALVLAATLHRRRVDARAERARAAATGGLADALSSFAAELRAGAPPAAAAASAGSDAHPVAARVMALIGATARLGGDVPAALRAARRREPHVAEHLDRLAGAWALADRHGIALAGPAGAVAHDLRSRARVAGVLRARVAGPRATAAVLAGLPVLGVLLGQGMGARPWAVLVGGPVGQVLLVVGVGLECAGLLWTERIVAGVAR